MGCQEETKGWCPKACWMEIPAARGFWAYRILTMDRSHPRKYFAVQNHLRNTSKPQPMTHSRPAPSRQGRDAIDRCILLFWGPEWSPQSKDQKAALGLEEVTDSCVETMKLISIQQCRFPQWEQLASKFLSCKIPLFSVMTCWLIYPQSPHQVMFRLKP